MASLPELIDQMGRRMFERRLTDISGGNISAREGNTLGLFAGGINYLAVLVGFTLWGCPWPRPGF